jgi:ATP-dependent DNA helicase DinG
VSEPARIIQGPWLKAPSLASRTADIFARVLPGAWRGYAPRDGQMMLTRAIAETVQNGGALLAEGPCGTGKTLAYLVPAILEADCTGRTVLVVTESIALQEQLVQLDLPKLANALSSELREPLTWTLLKGRSNYLCLNTAYADAPRSLSADERDELHAVDTWARTTETGDRLELPMIVRDGVWAMRSVESDDCLRDGCDYYDACFARKAKAKAEGVRVVVINYHLLFAHISVRRETSQDVIVPRTASKDSDLAWDTVLCDEAHKAGDVARDFMGCDLTERGAAKVSAWLKRDDKDAKRIDLAAQIDHAAARLWREMRDSLPDVRPGQRQEAHRVRDGLPADHLVDLLDRAAALATKIVDAIKGLGSVIDPDQRKTLRAAENAERRARRTRAWLDVAICPAEAPHTVLWLEAHTDKHDHESVRLCGRLLDVGTVLRAELFARSRAVVLSSATLTTGPLPALNALSTAGASDAWHWIRQQLGLPATTPALAVASPFDFRAQALLCLPAGMGDPTRDRDGFDTRVCEVVEETARAAGGRTLALFTSKRMMQRAAEHLRARALGFPVLCQGEQPRPHLLAAMKARPSILCATTSFWTGVDLPGEAVVAVVLDKMPFPLMGDPVIDALSDLAFARTGDRWAGWREESLPRAVLGLRQGAGRLIRDVADWGVVIVCDPRLTLKSYGPSVIRSLGMPEQARTLAAMREWFASRHPRP